MGSSPPQQTFWQRLTTFITNQTLLAWLTFIGFPLGIYGIYLSIAANKEIRPVYRVQSDVVLTDLKSDTNIAVLYRGAPVTNVHAATILIWNAGNEFLSKESFSKDKPISISNTGLIGILDIKQVKTTRQDLNIQFKTSGIIKIIREKGKLNKQAIFSRYAALEIIGDEGLEANDGIAVSIIYTKLKPGSWYVTGRIKGHPAGFKEAPASSETYSNWIISVIVALSGFSGVLVAQFTVKKKIKSFIGILITIIVSIITAFILLIIVTFLHTVFFADPPSIIIH